jgi:hypothetical protein
MLNITMIKPESATKNQGKRAVSGWALAPQFTTNDSSDGLHCPGEGVPSQSSSTIKTTLWCNSASNNWNEPTFIQPLFLSFPLA